MFAKARVHNIHTWQGEALRGRVLISAKVAKEVIAVPQEDRAIFMLTVGPTIAHRACLA